MLILFLVCVFALLSCAAAAGLIASTQNGNDAARSLTGLSLGAEESAG